MSEEITASEAERRYGITDKTIRQWIKQGILPARHLTKTKLAISVEDIEAVARERGYLVPARRIQREQPSEATRNDLDARMTKLEEEVVLLKMQVAKLHQDQAIRPIISEAAVPLIRTDPKDPLPQGCVLASKFAEAHGVSRSTMRWQMERKKISYSERPKAGRARETERYFTPLQQEDTLAYWRSQGLV